MGTRSYAQVAPTAGTIALNAYIYGYGGHSLVTPHHTLKQLWWTDDRINSKVTRSFVVSKLRGEEREFLDRPLAFGEGLTDDTYMEWILERARRLFLILAEIGVPDQIFGCIDDSWDDADLPIKRDNVAGLELAYENDEALNQKFYDTQFVYLLRELQHGKHIEYGPREHIPMEHVNTLPPAVTLQSWDRVHFPGRPAEIFTRRKLSLYDKETGREHRDEFMRDIRKAQALSHEHIASTWASYVSDNSGYILSDFVAEHTLGTFIDHRTPAQFVRVAAPERPALLCEWMHCLADALASLHHRGVAHTAIRPSNILIDNNNHIAFADVGSLRTFQRGKKAKKTEAYDYAAPESQICKSPHNFAASPPMSSLSAFSKLRKFQSYSDAGSSSTSSTSNSSRPNSIIFFATSPRLSFSGRRNSISTLATTITNPSSPPPKDRDNSSLRNFSRHLMSSSSAPSMYIPNSPPLPPPPPQSSPRILPRPTILNPDALSDLPAAIPEMSDIYSLGCVFLDLLTFLIKGKATEFAKFRSSLITPSPSYTSHPNNSSTTAATAITATTIVTQTTTPSNQPLPQISPPPSIPPTPTTSTSHPRPSSTFHRPPKPPRPRLDTSFHANQEKLLAWLDHLSNVAAAHNLQTTPRLLSPENLNRHQAQLYAGLPSLVALVRSMLAQNATLRPTALEVRERLAEVLLGDCGLGALV
ncbi:hypothetical protein MBLNU230_g3938t1 [Neophaeotheca triangularis]